MKWISENWDKIITAIISIIVAGVVGFYSAISVSKDQITGIDRRVVALETDSTNLIKPKIDELEENVRKLLKLESDISLLKTKNDIAAQTNLYLVQVIEKERDETLKALKKLLDKK